METTYRPDNLLGNVIGVIADRSNLAAEEVAARFASTYGEGDFDAAEQAFWDRHAGPLCDHVMSECGIAWA